MVLIVRQDKMMSGGEYCFLKRFVKLRYGTVPSSLISKSESPLTVTYFNYLNSITEDRRHTDAS
jgi:hypothetical protein